MDASPPRYKSDAARRQDERTNRFNIQSLFYCLRILLPTSMFLLYPSAAIYSPQQKAHVDAPPHYPHLYSDLHGFHSICSSGVVKREIASSRVRSSTLKGNGESEMSRAIREWDVYYQSFSVYDHKSEV